MSGANFFNSLFQFSSNVAGATTIELLYPFSLRQQRRAITWSVFPSPISSARTAPSCWLEINISQEYPTVWYSNKSACSPCGFAAIFPDLILSKRFFARTKSYFWCFLNARFRFKKSRRVNLPVLIPIFTSHSLTSISLSRTNGYHEESWTT